MCPARGSAGLPSSLANCCNNAWNGRRLGLAAEAALCHWWCQECKPPSFIIRTHSAEAGVLSGRHGEQNMTLAERPLAVGRGGAALQFVQDDCSCGASSPGCYGALMPVCQTCLVHVYMTTKPWL